MKLYYVYILVFSALKSLQPITAVRFCQPLSEIKGTTPIIKKIGDHFNMRCPFHPCIETAGNICNFTKVNKNTGKPELVHQGRVLNITITDLNDAGTYCYTPHCASNTESCCINIQVQSEITFHMTEIAYLHQNYTATCTIRSNPRTKLYIFTQGCHFKCTILPIDEDTTEAIIIISNITQECINITCATNLFQKSKRVELLSPPEPTEPATLNTPKTQPPTTQLPNEAISNHSSYAAETNISSNRTAFPTTARSLSTMQTVPSTANVNRISLILILIICMILLIL